MDLKDIRNDIDTIDTQICSLFRKRMDLALEVAKEKERLDLPVLNSDREQEVLQKISAEIGEPLAVYGQILFKTIFEVSKSYQEQYLNRK